MSATPALLQRHIFAHPSVESFNPYSQAIFRKLRDCHTAAIGMHRLQCDQSDCNHSQWLYHSCGNRHCPSCGYSKKEQWINDKMADLLPTAYYHVVFTLPHELNALIMGHRTCVFKLLFQAAAHTLLTLGKDPAHLGAEIGFTSILHTWGQDLSFHPHVHCVVSAGGVNHGKWIEAKRPKQNFLFPVGAMKKIFKGYFMQHLRKLFDQKKITVDADVFDALLKTIGFKKWNVYAKKPFGGPQQVIEYLGRYTHKVAITPQRIITADENHITFRYKDYRDGDKQKVMTVSSTEFTRRFEQHFLPKGFVKIRSYGYLKHYQKHKRLNEIRKQLHLPDAPLKVRVPVRIWMIEKHGKDILLCPKCEKGTMLLMETIRPCYDHRVNPRSGRGEAVILNNHQSP